MKTILNSKIECHIFFKSPLSYRVTHCRIMGATICGCNWCRLWVPTSRLEVWPRACTMKSKSLIDFISKFIQMPFTPICRCFTTSVPFRVDHGSFFVKVVTHIYHNQTSGLDWHIAIVVWWWWQWLDLETYMSTHIWTHRIINEWHSQTQQHRRS